MKTFHEILKDTFNKEFELEFKENGYNQRYDAVKKLFESIYSTREQKIFFLGCWLSQYLTSKQINELQELLGFGEEPPQA